MLILVALLLLLAAGSADASEPGLPFADRTHRTKQEIAVILLGCVRGESCALNIPFEALIPVLADSGFENAVTFELSVGEAEFVKCTEVFGDIDVPFMYVTSGPYEKRKVASDREVRTCKKGEMLLGVRGSKRIIYFSDWCLNPTEGEDAPQVVYSVPTQWCEKAPFDSLHDQDVDLFVNCK
jgi:hypothetical protein